ncbi:MAG TPA: DNA photolyase [Candidatus Marinimicrobia bacterium]|nr:DNA photolyase [Candidatus Neomarinimicrobiota bacterium]
MIETIYIEEAVRSHPRTSEILARFPGARRIRCHRYGEVFNPRGQDFRIQKRRPALILAEKFKNFVLPAPEGFGIGGSENFYFSHMLNCLYDCRYCFLQGMYQSAHYVMFVNHESFMDAIDRRLEETKESQAVTFFSGYDCDSLALESVTGFVKAFLPFFRERPRALLELRTKSVRVQELLKTEPFENCVTAFSFTPAEISEKTEHGVPPVASRIEAMAKLAEAGWKVGLRLDPLIYHKGFENSYSKLVRDIFNAVPPEAVHSTSLGPMRFPKAMYDRIVRLYPDDRLLAGPLSPSNGMVTYRRHVEEEMTEVCRALLGEYVPEEKFFHCTPWA